MRNSESEDELGEREKPPRPPKPPKIPSKLLRLHSSVANPNDKMMSIRRNPHKVTIGPGTRFKSFKTHLPRTGLFSKRPQAIMHHVCSLEIKVVTSMLP